jgi:hypothetical protein
VFVLPQGNTKAEFVFRWKQREARIFTTLKLGLSSEYDVFINELRVSITTKACHSRELRAGIIPLTSNYSGFSNKAQ